MSCEVLNKIGTGDCENKIHLKSETSIAQIIATELVTEILENALDIVEESEKEKPTKVVGDILENLASKFHEMNISEENKDLVVKVSEKDGSSLPSKGLGDQLEGEEEIINEEPPVRHPPVEKKNRLTDLVKNSKHVLARFILNDRSDPNEERNEKVIRVVDFDSGDQPFKTKKKILPEHVPLPRSDSKEILEGPPKEESMDEIQLIDNNDKSTERSDEAYKRTMTFPLGTSSGKNMSMAARCRTLKFGGELKKKKWNIGTKLINYIRKHNKKEDKEKEIDGVEIQPTLDNK